MKTQIPKVSLAIEKLGSDAGSARAEFMVLMKIDGDLRVCEVVIEGKTDSLYMKPLEWSLVQPDS
jgi:hypothetical protein